MKIFSKALLLVALCSIFLLDSAKAKMAHHVYNRSDGLSELKLEMPYAKKPKLVLKLDDRYKNGIYGGEKLSVEVKILEENPVVSVDTRIYIYATGAGTRSTAIVIKKGMRSATANISIPKVDEDQTLNLVAKTASNDMFSNSHKVDILSFNETEIRLTVDEKHEDGVYGKSGEGIPATIKIPEGRENTFGLTEVMVVTSLMGVTSTTFHKIPIGHREMKCYIPVEKISGKDQILEIYTSLRGDIDINSEEDFQVSVNVLASGRPFELEIKEDYNEVYGGITIPVKVKLPSRRENHLAATPVTLTYRLGKADSSQQVKVIEAGKDEVLFDIRTKKNVSSQDQTLTISTAAGEHFTASASKEIKILSSGKPLELEIEEKYNQVYGGSTIPVKVKLPSVRISRLSATPVTLTYRLGKVDSSQQVKVIEAGKDEVLFDIRTKKNVSSQDQTLTISTAAGEHFTASASREIKILSSSKPLELEIEEKYNQVYGGSTIPVKVKIPSVRISRLSATPVTLTYQLGGEITSETKWMGTRESEVLFDIKTKKNVSNQDQTLTISTVAGEHFTASASREIKILSSSKPLELEIEEKYNQVYGGSTIPVKVKIPSARISRLLATPVTLTYRLGKVDSSQQVKVIEAGKDEVLFDIKTKKNVSNQDQTLTISTVAGEHFTASASRETEILSSVKPLELEIEEKYNQVYGGSIIPVKVKIPSVRISRLSATPVTLTYQLGGEITSETKWMGTRESEVLFDIKTKKNVSSQDQTLTISTAAGEHFTASASREIEILSSSKPLELEIEEKYNQVYGGSTIPVKVKMPSVRISRLLATPVTLTYRLGKVDSSQQVKVIEAGKDEVLFDIKTKKNVSNQDQTLTISTAAGEHFTASASREIKILSSVKPLELEIEEKYNQVYGGSTIPVKVKLPSVRISRLSATPVTLTYRLGKVDSSQQVKVIEAGKDEVLFDIKTKKNVSNQDQTLTISTVAGEHFTASASRETEILSSVKPLELEIEEKYNQVYGGSIIPVKVKIPSVRISRLSATPVTLTYQLGGEITSETKWMGTRESEVLFDIKTKKNVSNQDQTLTITTAAGEHFTASASKEIEILSSVKPLELEIEEKYNEVYGGSTIPVKVKLPSGRISRLLATPVTLTYSLGDTKRSLINSIGIEKNETVFEIPVDKVVSSVDQKLIVSASTSDHFQASENFEMMILSSDTHSFELSVAEKDKRIRGGGTIAVKIGVPAERKNTLAKTPVVLIHNLGGASITETKFIDEDSNHVIFDVPVAEVTGGDQIRTLSVSAADHFKASAPLNITVCASDAPQIALSADATEINGGVPFLVTVKLPQNSTVSLPVTITCDGGKQIQDIFEPLEYPLVVEAGKNELSFNLVAKKNYGDDRTTQLSIIASNFRDSNPLDMTIRKSSGETSAVSSTNHVLKTYGGASFPVKATIFNCGESNLTSTTITPIYSGDGAGLVVKRTTPIQISGSSKEATFQVTLNKAVDGDKMLQITAQAADVDRVELLKVHILQSNVTKLHLNTTSTKLYAGESVSATIKIPKTLVNDLAPIPIKLTYGGDVDCITQVRNIEIKKGQDEVTFAIAVKKNSDQAKKITLLASADNFISSDLVSIDLAKLPLDLSVLVKNNKHVLTEIKGGQVTPIEIKGGQVISFKVKIGKPVDRPLNKPVQIKLSYTGNGLSEINNPIKSITIDPVEDHDEKMVELDLKNITSKAKKELEITATADHCIPALSLNLILLKNVNVLTERNRVLTLPKDPVLYLDENGQVKSIIETETFKSPKAINGFWIDCNLQAIKNGQLVSISTNEAYAKLNESQETKKSDIISLWIPLKDNPHHYWATTTYRAGESRELYYGHSETVNNSITTGATIATSRVDERGKVDRSHSSDLSQHAAGGSLTVQAGLSLRAGNNFFATVEKNLSIAISGHYDYTHSKTTGIEAQESSSFSLRNEHSKMTNQEHMEQVRREGPPMPYFKTVYVPFYPTIRYCYGDPNDQSPNYLGRYIDDAAFKNQHKEEGEQTIENYVKYIFKSDRVLSNYINNYRAELSSRNTDNSLINSMPTFMRTGGITDIAIQNYVVYILNGEIKYGDPANPLWKQINVPTHCSPVPINMTQSFIRHEGRVTSNFSFDIPASATESKLKLVNTSLNRVFYPDLQRRNYVNGEPLRETPDLAFDSYPYGTYTVEVQYRCGTLSEWSEPSEKYTFDYKPCVIPSNSFKATPKLGGGVTIEWGEPPTGANRYKVEYAVGDQTFEDARKEMTVFGTGVHPFEEERIGLTYEYLGNEAKVSFRVTPECTVYGRGAQTIFVYLKPCTVPEAPEVYINAVGELEYRLKHSGNFYDGYDIEVKKETDSWDHVEKRYGGLVQRYAVDKNGALTKNRMVTDVIPDFFDYTDKNIRRVARIKAICSHTRKSTDYSPDSEPFIVPVSPPSSEDSSSTTSTTTSAEEQQDEVSSDTPTLAPAKVFKLIIVPNCVEENTIKFLIENIEEPISKIEVELYRVMSSTLIKKGKILKLEKGEIAALDGGLLDKEFTYVLRVRFPNGLWLSEQFCVK